MEKKIPKRKPQPVDIKELVYGKVPPHAVEIEKAILGAIMLEKSAIDIAQEYITADMFYLNAHQTTYKAILALQNKNMNIDIETVGAQLKDSGELTEVGGGYYLVSLTNAVVSSAHMETHCQFLKQYFTARELIRISAESIALSYDKAGDIFDTLSEHERQITELVIGGSHNTIQAIDSALVGALTRLEKLRSQDEHITGVPCGFADLDRITNGWQNSDLIIMAARPAVGKTALALNFARNAALNIFKPTPVLFFSLEMSTDQLVNRIMSAESGIWLEKIRNGRMEDGEMRTLYEKGIQKLLQAKFFIDDAAGLNIMELSAKARKWKRKMKKDFGIDDLLIIIDYLQLMSGVGKGGNREQEISQISRGLKKLAKELNIPIIALSQLSRAVESRGEGKKMPQLSDLRESGAIEQDADMVMFIYRPEYYDNNTDEMGESNKGETHIKIAKHRNGSLDTVKLLAKLHIQKFESWDNTLDLPAKAAESARHERWRPVRDGNDFIV